MGVMDRDNAEDMSMVERFLGEVGWKRDRKGGNNRDY
jgi:hypothetical protein